MKPVIGESLSLGMMNTVMEYQIERRFKAKDKKTSGAMADENVDSKFCKIPIISWNQYAKLRTCPLESNPARFRSRFLISRIHGSTHPDIDFTRQFLIVSFRAFRNQTQDVDHCTVDENHQTPRNTVEDFDYTPREGYEECANCHEYRTATIRSSCVEPRFDNQERENRR